ncbi:MAG: iron complex outerrane recepter protein [Sphingomonadales bacterium]|jgi:iron complex outermembrane receptor protein|nr:iron complex outerrane recepter protein [Sphingomonadales bacterium]
MKKMFVTLALSGSLLPAMAHAANAGAADPNAAVPSAAAAETATDDALPSASADAEADAGVPDIVVTATKRETNLQRTPIAIAVVNSQALTDRHVQSLLDLADGAVPSLRVATFEARQTALTIGIRGIVPLDANQPAREQGVGVYLDGVYLGRQHGLNAALFDVERVEVLKGPQGTLFGRNTEGGALSIVSRPPSGVFEGRVTAGIGNYGGYNVTGHIDLPAIAGIAFKFDGVLQHQDATTRNPLAGQTGWNYFDRHGFRVAARWKPVSNVTVDLAYDNGYDANSAFYSQLLNYNPNHCTGTVNGANTPASAQPQCILPGTAPTSFSGTVKPLPPIVVVNGTTRMKVADIGVPQQPSVDTTHGYTANLKWKATDDIELRSITAWRGVNSAQWDNSGGAHRPPVFAPNGAFSRYSLADLHQTQFSQELQLVGSLPQIDYVAGLYYFNEKANDDAATPNSNTWNATGTGYTINDPTPQQPGFRSIDRASRASDKSYAIFGQATYSPLDTVHVTIGGRGTWDDKQGALYIVNNLPRPYTFRQKTSRFNPLAILAWDAAPGINLYAKYATGYRAGGASSRSVTYRQFGPEDVKSYEIGAKTEFLNHRVRLNLAGYIMDRTGSQIDFSTVQFDAITNSNRNTIETVNAPGTTKIRGFEADLTVNPLAGLTLSASYAYTHTDIPLVANPVTGVFQKVYVVFTPRNAASGAIDYATPVGGATLKLHLDANYADATQTFDQYATRNDRSFIVNGRLALADIGLGAGGRKLTLAIWSRNLFNEAHVYRRDPSNSLGGLPAAVVVNGQNTFPVSSVNNILGDYGNFNAPRTFGVEGTVQF